MDSYKNSPYYTRLKKIFDQLTGSSPELVNISNTEYLSHISIITEATSKINLDLWPIIEKGLTRYKKLKITYRNPIYPNGETRIIKPYHMVGHKGEWYLIAEHKEKIKIYNLSRIGSCKLSKESFNYPSDFKLEDYCDPEFGVFVNEETIDVTIKFYHPTSKIIKEKIWHKNQKITDLDDGSILLTFETNQHSQLIYWVSQWGAAAEIIEPVELRDRMKEWLLGAVNRYE